MSKPTCGHRSCMNAFTTYMASKTLCGGGGYAVISDYHCKHSGCNVEVLALGQDQYKGNLFEIFCGSADQKTGCLYLTLNRELFEENSVEVYNLGVAAKIINPTAITSAYKLANHKDCVKIVSRICEFYAKDTAGKRQIIDLNAVSTKKSSTVIMLLKYGNSISRKVINSDHGKLLGSDLPKEFKEMLTYDKFVIGSQKVIKGRYYAVPASEGYSATKTVQNYIEITELAYKVMLAYCDGNLITI